MSEETNNNNEEQQEVAEAKPVTKESKPEPAASKENQSRRYDLLVIGIVFIAIGMLLLYFTINDDADFYEMALTYWPVLIIVAGLVKILQALMGVQAKGSGLGWLVFIALILFGIGQAQDAIIDEDWDFHVAGCRMSYPVNSYSETFDAAEATTLNLDLYRTKVKIFGSSSKEIRIQHRTYVRSWSRRHRDADYDDVRAKISQDGETIRLVSHPERQVDDERIIHTEILLYVPDTIAVVVKGGRSDVRLEDMDATADFDMRNGDCEVIDCTGDVNIKGDHIEIDVINHEGALTVRGRSMEIDLEETYGRVDIDVQRTSVDVDNVRPQLADLMISTTRASIDVEIDGSSEIEFEGRTRHGKIYVEFDNVDTSESGEFKQSFNGGKYKVILATEGANISLEEQ